MGGTTVGFRIDALSPSTTKRKVIPTVEFAKVRILGVEFVVLGGRKNRVLVHCASMVRRLSVSVLIDR